MSDTGGLASPYLWDTSASWEAAGIGIVDTGGSILVQILEVPKQEETPGSSEDVAQPEEPHIAQLMSRDDFFKTLVEQGLEDLELGRYDPIRNNT